MLSPQTVDILKVTIPTVIGGGLVLIGTFLGSFLDARKKRVAVLRGRGEELYVLCDKWMEGLFVQMLRLSSVMEGKMTYNQALDLEIAQGKDASLNFGRMEMLIDVYFPSVRPAYDSAASLRDDLAEIAGEHKLAYSKGDTDGRPYLAPFVRELRKIDHISAALNEAVIKRLRSL